MQHDPLPFDLEEAFPKAYGHRYILLSELGEGGMGKVFMALAGERVCAIKVLRLNNESPAARQHFKEEAALYTRLNHHNVVYAHETGVVAGQTYVAMEYLRGKTLYQTMGKLSTMRRHVPGDLAFWVTKEILRGLAYLHKADAMNLVHRDLSPTNVMVTYDGAVKIIDLGLAKWRDKTTETLAGGDLGQPGYKSPEHSAGGIIDQRSDIFCVGIILWEMLTGRSFLKQTSIQAPSKFVEYLPWQVDAVVMTALATRPDDRYKDAESFIKELSALIPAEADGAALQKLMNDVFFDEIDKEAATRNSLLAAAAHCKIPETPTADGADADVTLPVATEDTERKPRLGWALVLIGSVMIPLAGAWWLFGGPHGGVNVHRPGLAPSPPAVPTTIPAPIALPQVKPVDAMPSGPSQARLPQTHPARSTPRVAPAPPTESSPAKPTLESLLEQGWNALSEGRALDAVEAGVQAQQLRKSAETHALLGAAYLGARDFVRAETELEIAIRMNPADVATANRLRVVKAKLGPGSP